MEGGSTVSWEKQKGGGGEGSSSYRYWVREVKKEDAAPLPVARKLNPQELTTQRSSSSAHLGSAWNQAGTWEEKNLNKWADDKIKELLNSIATVEFSDGKAEISGVSKCKGDAFAVTVRNKKRVGYTYELTLRVKGEWLIKEEKKAIKGYIDVLEFSFGELGELEIEVRLDEKDLLHQDKTLITKDLKLFLEPIREKLREFELELKDR